MDLAIDSRSVDQLRQHWQAAPKVVQQELLRTITESDLLNQGELMQKLPRGAGGLHGAGLASSIFREEHVLVDNVLGMVATNESYADYVETGTKPHPVGTKAITSLADWAQQRLGVPQKEAKDVAEAIAWKIRHKGTPAQPVWQPTYVRSIPIIKHKFVDCVRRILQRLAGGKA